MVGQENLADHGSTIHHGFLKPLSRLPYLVKGWNLTDAGWSVVLMQSSL